MTDKCPYHQTKNQAVWWLIREIKKTDSIRPDGIKSHGRVWEYALFAVKIEQFYEENHELLSKALNNLYEASDSRDDYLQKIRRHIGTIIELREFPKDFDLSLISINNWIGTMIFVLRWIFEHVPEITQEECLKLCRKWMKELDVTEFPHSRSTSTKELYSIFVKEVLNNTVQKDKEDKLSCPALYTLWWNKFLEMIIQTIFEKFPSKEIVK